MSWYCMYGDPRWDADELWSTMGHLYKGGMWFKKKSVLQAENHYSTEKSANGSTDLRTTEYSYSNNVNNSGISSVADVGNYFYLPALGAYNRAVLGDVGSRGNYWSSSSAPSNYYNAYILSFGSGNVNVARSGRASGYRAEVLQ